MRYLASSEQTFSLSELPRKPEVVIFKHSSLLTAPLVTKKPER